jgi:signal transduction histidine kinase
LYYHLLVRKYDYPFYADWYAISLRWLGLIGATISLVKAGVFNNTLAGALLAGIIWNLVCTLLASINRRFGAHRGYNVLVDSIIATVLFVSSGGLYGPLSWIGVLPLISAGIYFGWIGSMVMTGVITLLQLLGFVWALHLPLNYQGALLLTGFNLLSGFIFGMLSSKLYQQLRERFQDVQHNRKVNDDELRGREWRRMQGFFHLLESINASLDYMIVLQTALDLTYDILADYDSGDESLVTALLLFDGSHLKPVLEHGLKEADNSRRLPAESGALYQCIQTGEVTRVRDIQTDSELGGLQSLKDCQSAILLPLRRGLDSYGVLLCAHQDSDFFDDERQDILSIISQQASIAIQNSLLFQDLQAERDRLVRNQEEERKLVARDLHDGPTQSVTGIAMRAEYIRRMVKEGISEDDLIAELEQIEVMARKTTQEIRGMLFSLRPLVLEKEGLLNALRTLTQNMRELYQQNVVLNVNEKLVDSFNASKQKVIFQIVDEAVNNSRKHARASLIQVNLQPMQHAPDIGLLEVIDNGVGFDLKAVSGSYEMSGSLGMVTLRERAELINGRINIDSVPGKGTKVQVALPLSDRATDYLHGGKNIQ